MAFDLEAVYRNPVAKGEEAKAQMLLEALFQYFVKNPDKMSPFYYGNTKNEPVERCVCDYISSMTDRYAIDTYKKLFIPAVWQTPMEY